ncbi:MAG: ATP-binding cassette domain-containing protein, partial [Microcystaceae cyanobacterium]
VSSVYPEKSPEEKEQLVAHYLEMVGLTEAAKKKPHQLSGGMKQRVAIARALAISPEVLILDEPFGALDAITKEELQEELLKIWRENQLTVLMITHDIDEALFLADRLVMMTNGPSAKIGEILEIPFARPRNRAQMMDDPQYYELRNYALDFLFHRYAHDEDDEVEESPTNYGLRFKQILAGVASLAAIALVGIGLVQTFSGKGGDSSQPAVTTPVTP